MIFNKNEAVLPLRFTFFLTDPFYSFSVALVFAFLSFDAPTP